MKRSDLTHLNDKGEVRMVDIGGKARSVRRAVALARISMSRKTLSLLKRNELAKGDALATARIAGIQAAKETSKLIPLTHPIPLTFVSLDLTLVDQPPAVEIRAEAKTDYKTGVEMEALTAASVAALTIYDMCKAVDSRMVIESVRLIKKTKGGKGK